MLVPKSVEGGQPAQSTTLNQNVYHFDASLQVNINKAKKDKFKILRPDLDAVPEDDPFFDPALNVDRKKILRPRRAAFQFVEEGRWSQQAEAQRLRVCSCLRPLFFRLFLNSGFDGQGLFYVI